MSDYKADFLWPFDDGSIEEAGYEFANGQTSEYQKLWWKLLNLRIEDKIVSQLSQELAEKSKEEK